MMGTSLPAESREQALDRYWDAVVEHLPADSLRLTLVDASDAFLEACKSLGFNDWVESLDTTKAGA